MTAEKSGTVLERVAIVATMIFGVVTGVAIFVEGVPRMIAVVLSLVLFGLGCALTLLAFALGVGKSRTHEISVAELFLLMGSVPARVRRTFHSLTATQTVIAVIGASIRPFTALAFGILVPMFGIGIGAVWAAKYGMFAPRSELDHKRPEHARPGSSATPPGSQQESLGDIDG